jgi:hypothetical protein
MLSKFNNEVLSKGPGAVLPQNLSREWIDRLKNMAEEFLDINFSLDECGDPQGIADPILSACVYEILRQQSYDTDGVSTEEMLEKTAIYAVSISMEAVNREADIGLDPPNLDNILSRDSVIAFKEINPDFINLLEQACVIRDSR